MRSLEFLVGLLDGPHPACVGAEDFDGPHGDAVRSWQAQGFIDREPSANPTPSCPECEDGVPYRLGKQCLCHRCRSLVEPQNMMLWGFDREAFLGWLGRDLSCRGELRPVGPTLWQLGTRLTPDGPLEFFYRFPMDLSEPEKLRLRAYRNTLVLFGRSLPADIGTSEGRCLSLLEILSEDGFLAMKELERFLRSQGSVRFDARTGVLWVGRTRIGEVPVGSKEYFFVVCLANDLDHFVSYADIKREVLRNSGGTDETEEATFCQKLKSRIKTRHIPEIDRLIVTTNKGDGYRLRGHGEPVDAGSDSIYVA